jgi:hypothetical protein
MPTVNDPTRSAGNEEMSPAERHIHGRIDSWLARQGITVRKRGLVKIAIGIPVAVAWFLIQQRLEDLSEWLKFIVPGFPGVLVLIGIVELVGGIPVSDLARRWDTLRGWQRGILGMLVVAAFTAILFAAIYLFLVPETLR